MSEESRMPLVEHLKELRGRLIRCVIAVVILGGISLIFSRQIFAVLMRPVLDAMPPGHRALIFTSGIEELNTLMKSGLYTGVFLGTPVFLWQIWGFISPGLLPNERRFAGPFIFLGSAAFMIGACFCYFVMLPTMFQFLLNTGDVGPLKDRVADARMLEGESLRYLRLGDPTQAGALAQKASVALAAGGGGRVAPFSGDGVEHPLELTARMDALGRLIDATRAGLGPSSTKALEPVMAERLKALEAAGNHRSAEAAKELDAAAGQLGAVSDRAGPDLSALWKLERQLARGKARIAAASWTKPLLTMREQLSLVLLLELAIGAIFELPMVLALLGMLGLVKWQWLAKYQRHAFLVVLVVAAVITPTGDPINLSILAGPMFACYELGVLAVWLIDRRRRRASSALTSAG